MSHRQIVDSLRKHSYLSNCPFRVFHLPKIIQTQRQTTDESDAKHRNSFEVLRKTLNKSRSIAVPVPGGQGVPRRAGRPSGSCCSWAFPRSWGRRTPRHRPDVSSSKCQNHRMTCVEAGGGERRRLAVGQCC